MNIQELIEALEEADDLGITEIECHFQPNYPLKAELSNVRRMDGKLVLALGCGSEYGSRRAWDDEDDEHSDCDECGDAIPLDDDICDSCQMEERIEDLKAANREIQEHGL